MPIISLYVFAGYRLMPAVQKFIALFQKFLFLIHQFLNYIKILKLLAQTNQKKKFLTPSKNIKLKSIYYNYPNSSRILKNININIK